MPENIESLLLNQRYWDIFAVARNSSIDEACRIMDKNRIGALLVYCSDTNDPQDLEGIVTERDVIELISRKGKEALNNEVKEIIKDGPNKKGVPFFKHGASSDFIFIS